MEMVETAISIREVVAGQVTISSETEAEQIAPLRSDRK